LCLTWLADAFLSVAERPETLPPKPPFLLARFAGVGGPGREYDLPVVAVLPEDAAESLRARLAFSSSPSKMLPTDWMDRLLRDLAIAPEGEPVVERALGGGRRAAGVACQNDRK